MRDFTKGSVTKQILMFSLPMLVGNLFQQVYSMVDAVVVGRYEGGTALAAVGVSMNVLMFLTSMLIGLTTGASIVIAQFYGAREYEKLERTVATSVVFLAALSVVIGVLGVAFAPALMGLLGVDPLIMGDAVTYMRVLVGGMLFTVFYNMLTAYLRALGDSRGPLFILILCTVLNTGLDLLFVASFGMGVFGVAVATVISQALSVVLCYMYTCRRVPMLRIRGVCFDAGLFRALLKYGIPSAVQLSVVSLANLTITRLINSFGPEAMAGVTAAHKIDQVAMMPINNLGMALAAFVGQNMGAGQELRARRGLRSSLVLMVGFAACMSGVLIAFGPQLIAMFLNPEDANMQKILDVGLGNLNIMVVFYFLFAVMFAFNGFFRGSGDAVIAMAFPIISLAIRSAAAHMLVNFGGMGPDALAWSIPIGWGVCDLACIFYYRKRLWVGKLVVSAQPRE